MTVLLFVASWLAFGLRTWVLARSVGGAGGPSLTWPVSGYALAATIGQLADHRARPGSGCATSLLVFLLGSSMSLVRGVRAWSLLSRFAVTARRRAARRRRLGSTAAAIGCCPPALGRCRAGGLRPPVRLSRMASERKEQLAYSEQMAAMLDEDKRRQKAAKILAVLRHALGRDDLSGLRAVDVGCSAGFIADELAGAGATTHGVDIDEPGLARARARFGDRVTFHCAPGDAMPFEDGSVDVVVLNHIYEHVVDPDAVAARDPPGAVRPDGVRLPRAGQPARRGRAALPTAVPVLAAARPAGRPLRAGLRPGRPLLRAVPHPPPGCAGWSPRSTPGTTPCRCSPTRPGSTAATWSRAPSRASPTPVLSARCRSCRPTSGSGSARRAPRRGRP